MKILKVIEKDILAKKEFVEIFGRVNENELFKLHFYIGLYIRNKYIWNNEKNYQILSKHYNVTHPDDISSCIIRDLYKIINKKD